MAKKATSQAIAALYEPTLKEAAVLTQYDRNCEQRPAAPSLNVTMSTKAGKRTAAIAVDHPDLATGYKLLSVALGGVSRDFLQGTIDSLAMAAQTGEEVSQDALNYNLAFVLGLKPQDTVEANLAVQMAAIHAATMKSAVGLAGSKTWESWDRQERALNRLSRTFAAQVEALKRYRSKGEQRVYVERVNVAEGGQAIVGNVATGDGGGGGAYKNAN